VGAIAPTAVFCTQNYHPHQVWAAIAACKTRYLAYCNKT